MWRRRIRFDRSSVKRQQQQQQQQQAKQEPKQEPSNNNHMTQTQTHPKEIGEGPVQSEPLRMMIFQQQQQAQERTRTLSPRDARQEVVLQEETMIPSDSFQTVPFPSSIPPPPPPPPPSSLSTTTMMMEQQRNVPRRVSGEGEESFGRASASASSNASPYGDEYHDLSYHHQHQHHREAQEEAAARLYASIHSNHHNNYYHQHSSYHRGVDAIPYDDDIHDDSYESQYHGYPGYPSAQERAYPSAQERAYPSAHERTPQHSQHYHYYQDNNSHSQGHYNQDDYPATNTARYNETEWSSPVPFTQPPPMQESVAIVREEKHTWIEIAPGVELRFRGADETWRAIEQDFYTPAQCLTCEETIFCIQDASHVICPLCKVVSPLVLTSQQHSVHEHQPPNGGVGLGFTFADLASWQEEITRNRSNARR